ncbi:MAG: amidohydrolase/deacetylase family metallohydrolase [Deltaproteobacteria bacterium]|nr:amidohydrolase/deacetylase family metallohydrolase [Deltaproteobacteria bacterium]
MAIKYDLLLKGGEVIDPSQNLRARCDVAFHAGAVSVLAERIPPEEARESIDIAGKLVTPGLIDIHGHFFHRYQPRWGHPDAFCLPTGVTTAVDAGSAGWSVFPALRDYIIRQSETRLFAFVHLSSVGLNRESTNRGELVDLQLVNVEKTARCILDNPEYVVGLKVRIDSSATGVENAVPALERARQVADETGCRIMAHVSRTPIPLGRLLKFLRRGDIVTHVFNGYENNALDAQGKVRPEVWEARQEGILLDAGCAQVHFDVNVCRAAVEQGLLPDTLSTDGSRLEHSYSVPDVMSMFLALGMSLEEVVAGATNRAASAIGKADLLASLRVGAAGDAAVLALEDGNFAFDDRAGNVLRCRQRLVSVLTVRRGVRWRKPIIIP